MVHIGLCWHHCDTILGLLIQLNGILPPNDRSFIEFTIIIFNETITNMIFIVDPFIYIIVILYVYQIIKINKFVASLIVCSFCLSSIWHLQSLLKIETLKVWERLINKGVGY